MITDWNIVDTDMMREILLYYMQDPKLEKQVLEVQRIRDSNEMFKNTRYFFSRAITGENYPEWENADFFNMMLETIRKFANADVTSTVIKMTYVPISVCLWEDKARIIPIHCFKEMPLLTSPTIINIFGEDILTDEEKKMVNERKLPVMQHLGIKQEVNYALALWFYKDKDNNYSFNPEVDEKDENKQKVFRIRTLDLKTFEEATEEFRKDNKTIPDFIKKDDLVL